MFNLVQFSEPCGNERRDIVALDQIVLLQDEQVLACLEILASAAVDIAQEHQSPRQPVLLLGVHLGKLHHLRLCRIQIFGFVIALREQILGLCALRGAYLAGEDLQIRLRLAPLP